MNIKTWILASRPKTLPAAIIPVLVGTSVAYASGQGHILYAILALFGAVAIQVATNFVNDLFDFKKGADTEERLGPTRAVQAGLLSEQAIGRAAIIVFWVCFWYWAFIDCSSRMANTTYWHFIYSLWYLLYGRALSFSL